MNDYGKAEKVSTCGEKVFESGFREKRIDDRAALVWDASVEKFPAAIEN